MTCRADAISRAARLGGVVVLAAAGAMGPAACSSDPSQGYSFASTYRQDVETVAVPIFANQTFDHGVEAELASAIVAELRKVTPWRVDQSGSAQTTLSGVVTSSELRKLTTARQTGLVETLALVISVDFEWKDNRTGRVLAARRDFSAAEAFTPARGVGERIDTGRHAAVQELARAIVNELRTGW